MNGFFFLSVFNPEDPMPGLGPMSPEVRERLIFLGGVLLLLAGVLIVLVVRRKLKHRSKRRSHSRHRRPFPQAATGMAELKKMIHEKPRRRRRSHRQRNPTLAETGGLPPVRQDGSVEPPQTRTKP